MRKTAKLSVTRVADPVPRWVLRHAGPLPVPKVLTMSESQRRFIRRAFDDYDIACQMLDAMADGSFQASFRNNAAREDG